MFDKREVILQRMLAILTTIAGPPVVDGQLCVFRNRGEIPVEKMPALILLDGREAIKLSASGKGGILAPTTFTLQPQVFVVLKPTAENDNDGIGESLSDYRMRILKAFSIDDNLFALLGTNGELQYLGHETDMQTGSTMLGQMQMQFALTYVLNPTDL
jgi:hypothetical protein